MSGASAVGEVLRQLDEQLLEVVKHDIISLIRVNSQDEKLEDIRNLYSSVCIGVIIYPLTLTIIRIDDNNNLICVDELKNLEKNFDELPERDRIKVFIQLLKRFNSPYLGVVEKYLYKPY